MDERLLLNLLLSASPAVIYQLIMMHRNVDRDAIQSQVIIGLLGGISSVLCMAYPVVHGNNFLWDLRWIPFVFSIMYGRLRGGVIAATILVIYRFSLGGLLSSLTVLIDAVAMLIVLGIYTAKHRERNNLVRTLGISIAISAGTFVFVMTSIYLYLLYTNNAPFFLRQGALFYITYGLITVSAYIASVLLIENFFYRDLVRKELQQTERLHLLTDMAASFAHEIRNPLTVAKGFMQLLLEQCAELNKPQDQIKLVLAELDRTENVIGDYLSYARPAVDKVHIVSIPEVLEQIVGVMTPFAAMNNVSIQTSTESSLRIHANHEQFTQIVMNVVKNSVEAMPSGGTVHITATRQDNQACIQIKDDGMGMSKLQLLQLGKPYYSTKSNGTGLGLMVTFQLVKLLQGQLRYQSDKGKGTVATLQFPLAD